MRAYRLSHLSDRELLRDLAALVARDRTTTAAMLAHIAEVDARRLYVPAGYPSMFEYCVGELHLSEDATLKRIQAARAARQFPAIFTAVAEGKLHLSAVCLLAPHLRAENAAELLGAAAHQSKSEVELLLARRFPRTELLPMMHALPACPSQAIPEHAPGQVGAPTPGFDACPSRPPGHLDDPRPQVAPLSAESFALHLTIRRSVHDKIRYAQALTSHPAQAILKGSMELSFSKKKCDFPGQSSADGPVFIAHSVTNDCLTMGQ